MALSVFVCGQAGGNTDALVIPIGADVPRSDPVDGATIILIFYQIRGGTPPSITGASDDATPEDDYSFCLFGDGLNHYSETLTQPLAGLAANDLTNGVHNITVTLDAVSDWVQAVAVAVTGVALGGSGDGPIFDPALTGFLASLSQQAEAPVGGGGSTSGGIGWNQDAGGGITFGNPSTATDGDWDWILGDEALYWVFGGSATSRLGWTWTDGSIDDFFQYDVDTGSEHISLAIGTKAVVPTVAGPSIAGAWGDGTLLQGGSGLALRAGFGPGPCSTPAPFGNPCFNKLIPV